MKRGIAFLMIAFSAVVFAGSEMEIEGLKYRKEKSIDIEIYFPKNNYTEKEKKIIENTAKTCPVSQSLHPEIKQNIKNGLVTDTSFSNVLLYNGIDYFTPKTPLLVGTKRSLLLSQGLIKEKDIDVAQLSDYQHIILINAMMGIADGLVIPISQVYW